MAAVPPLRDPLLGVGADAAAICGWRWDLASGRVEWSRGLEELFGLAASSFAGTFDAYLAVLAPEDRDYVRTAIQRSLESRAPYEIEHRVLVAGETRWVACRGDVTLDGSGAVSGMAGAVWDITRRHDAEERLRQSEERLRFNAAVLSQVNEAIIATDVTAEIKYWNRAAEKLYGYSAEEAVGKNGTELLQTTWPNPADALAHADALRSSGSWRGEMTHVTKSGERIHVEASIQLLRDDTGKAIAGINVMQDVTAKRQLEEQLRHAQKMEAVGVLAGGVAHDFNNLLGVILGFTELTLQRLPGDHPDASSLREVISAGKRGADLTRKLLAFSRKQVMHLASLDLSAATLDIAKLVSRIVGEDVELVVEPAHGPLVIRADAGQIEQLLFNLCTNARQAMPSGGKLVLATRLTVVDEAFAIHHPWAKTGSFAELSVSDTGVGIEPGTMARIFEPFFTTKEQGTGLGLATVYGIVERHGGVVHAESVPGSGATFRVLFPLDDAPLVREPPRRLEPATPRGSETILVAEDAAPLRSLVTATLTRLGYRVIATEDGEQAVRAYERHAADIALVVLDVIMPRLGALEAYERMRTIRPDVRVLFTTGYAPEAGRLEEILDGERLRLLEKPFSAQTLGVYVREAIDA